MKLILFKLGSEDKGFIPSRKMFKEFRRMIYDCIEKKKDISLLLSHPFVTIKEVEIPSGASIGIFGEGLYGDDNNQEIERPVCWWKRLLRRLAK